MEHDFFHFIKPWTEGHTAKSVAGQLRQLGIQRTTRAVENWLTGAGVPSRLVVTPLMQVLGVPSDVQAQALRVYCPPAEEAA